MSAIRQKREVNPNLFRLVAGAALSADMEAPTEPRLLCKRQKGASRSMDLFGEDRIELIGRGEKIKSPFAP